jgi:hypothetical protein
VYQILEVGMSGTYSNAPCTEEGYKKSPFH